ncbi:MAG: NF038122 family metalloprotease [Phormidesmis sp.]
MVSFNFTFDAAVSLEQRVAFELAARIWGAYLTDDVSVNLHIASTDGLNGDAVGGAIPIFHDQLYGVYQGYAEADISPSQNTGVPSVDQQAFDSLQDGNTTDFLLDGQVIERNTNIALTSAQAKALGMDSGLLLENGQTWERNLVDANALDGYILINQSYDWSYDFLREKSAKGKTLDFLSMAMHEIGHNLGFVSGIDGAIELQALYSGHQEVDGFTALDLFRFSSNSAEVNNPDGSVSDVSVGGNAYFSIDSGATSLADFSTGQQVYLGGDGYQASHWKRLKKAMGIMDPTLAYKERLSLSLLDLQAMDVLGWDINYGALDAGGLDMHQLLSQAEMAVAHSLGVDSTLFSENKDHNNLYQLGYGALFQQFQAQMLELGYGALFQELEHSFEQWRQDGSLLNLGYGALFQQFETKMYELGYGALFQSFESDMFELGYGELFQMFELGYGALFQQLDAYFVDNAHDNVSVDTEVLDAHVGGNVAKLYEGGAADDILSGTDKQDRISGGDGDDFLDGRAGHDVLWGDAGQDIIYGERGNDLLRGGSGDDLLEGESGDDELYGDAGHDVLHGDEGEDLLSGGEGKDDVNGGWDNDVLSGGNGDDLLNASSGHDVAVGGDGNDKVNGGSGHDILYGDRTGIYAEENLQALKKQFASQAKNTTNNPPESNIESSRLNPVRLEAEAMNLFGQYSIEDLNDDSGASVRANADITGESIFNGPSGTYMVLARYLDEADGDGTLSISLNGSTLDDWTLSKNDERYHTRTIAQSVTLKTGDTISFQAALSAPNAQGKVDNPYLDYIELIPLDNLLTVALDSPAPNSLTADDSAADASPINTATSLNPGTIRVEAEEMTLAGEYLTKSESIAFNGGLIETTHKGTGLALTTFEGATGFYDIVVGYYDEQDGQATVAARLNNDELDSWTLDLNLGGDGALISTFATRTVAKGVLLNQNDIFKLTGVHHQGERARIDYVDFVKVAAPTADQSDSVSQVSENGLLAHWSFDEVVGNRAADSVGSADATLRNMESTDWGRGAVGNALRFDGTDEAFHVSETSQFDTGSDSDFSVAFWTKLEAGPTGDWRTIIFKGTNYAGSEKPQNRDFGIYLHPDSNRLHYRISTADKWNDGGNSQAVLQENQWYHIAYVKNGNELALYLNGEKDSSATLEGKNVDSGGDLWVGNTTASTLDDLRVYDRALTTEDLSELTSAWQPGGFDDVIQGGAGNDVVFGGAGRDVIYGDQEGGADSAIFYGAQFFKGSAYLLSQTGTWLDTQAEAQQLGGNLVGHLLWS